MTSRSMPSTDQGLVDRIDGLMSALPVRRRKMFGTSSWFLESNDQMFSGVWGDGLMLRVGEDETNRLVRSGEAVAFDPMGGRPMKEYVLVDAGSIAEDDSLTSWLNRGAQFTATLPTKQKKTKRKS